MSEISVQEAAGWTFLSNHGHVLICLALNEDDTMREVAQKVGITERAIQRIVTDLEEAGVIVRERFGRRNRYSVNFQTRLRHPIESRCTVGDLVRMVTSRERAVELA